MKSPIIAAVCRKQTPTNKKQIPYFTYNKLNFTDMKQKLYSVLIAFIIVLSSCSKEDEFKTIAPTSIAFVHADGSALELNECINPNTNYAVLIKTNAAGTGVFKSTKVEYTLNGVPHIMSFVRDGEQLNAIKLIGGTNTAEVVGTPFKAYLYFNTDTNFELVE